MRWAAMLKQRDHRFGPWRFAQWGDPGRRNKRPVKSKGEGQKELMLGHRVDDLFSGIQDYFNFRTRILRNATRAEFFCRPMNLPVVGTLDL